MGRKGAWEAGREWEARAQGGVRELGRDLLDCLRRLANAIGGALA